MKIGQNKVVELIYELEVEGQIVDHTTVERPLDFIQGTGSLLKAFEDGIEGLEAGAKFAFTLAPEQAYGLYEEDRVAELPIAAFEIDGQLREDLLVVGKVIPLTNSRGAVIPAKVLEIGELFVKMDLNHPMAGKTLNFSGEILSVREATEKELEEGLHGELAHHGCGHCHGGCHKGECHGGDCDGDCEGDCKKSCEGE